MVRDSTGKIVSNAAAAAKSAGDNDDDNDDDEPNLHLSDPDVDDKSRSKTSVASAEKRLENVKIEEIYDDPKLNEDARFVNQLKTIDPKVHHSSARPMQTLWFVALDRPANELLNAYDAGPGMLCALTLQKGRVLY